MLDYIIVGQGIAGSCFALKLMQEGKNFLVVDDDLHRASSVAVGVYNPVVLKRFSIIWNAEEQLKLLHKYFGYFEEILGENFLEEIPTFRIFHNPEEIEIWKRKSGLEELRPYLSDEISAFPPSFLNAEFGFSEVKQTGRIKLNLCLNLFKTYLEKNGNYLAKKFDYTKLTLHENEVQYCEIHAKQIVFCEGMRTLENPYFSHLPIIGVKGEVLKIEMGAQVPKAIWKAYNFFMPEDPTTALTASTYDREDSSYVPTENGKLELEKRLKEIYTGPYKILEHTAGIRPTVVDRRPILGRHPLHKNLVILNGMGTRGTLLAPQMTEFLYNHLEYGNDLPRETSLSRFDKFLENK